MPDVCQRRKNEHLNHGTSRSACARYVSIGRSLRSPHPTILRAQCLKVGLSDVGGGCCLRSVILSGFSVPFGNCAEISVESGRSLGEASASGFEVGSYDLA